ncbi:flagellin hook IN motif-containing protein [Methylopila sp. M107]|uniref:flagellin N-terminal helical domain-containing protein n=1 Tax=Methylopila sp. M107 TaxID=1101190 RepID=UPI0003800377|nr:flagellin hook IN motif-containing protein [Methylopila sp. M107]
MADITLNSAVRSNLRTLQGTTDLLNRTEERLSTGKKVNSAFDNPGSFFTSQALDRRSSDLTGLLDNVSNSVKTLEAADNGIKAINDVVEGLKATARQALQSPKGTAFVQEGGAFTSPTATGTITLAQGSATAKTVNLAIGDTAYDVAKKINDSGSGVSATVDDDGELKLQSDVAFTVGGTGATGVGLTAATVSTVTIVDQSAYDKRQGFLEDFNSALKQIDSLAKDSSFNGVNLLQGDDLEITFNEDGTSKLDVKGTQFGAAGLGLSELAASVQGTGTAVTSAGAFDTKEGINDVLDTLDTAFSTLESQSSKFGSQLQIVQTRETFTKDMIGTLDDGSLALVGADTNEEAANLATLQTRQSLIVSSLSISTQQESNVLQLLR